MTVNVDLLLILIVCFLINVKSGECFGLDVHHRYSDTVKEFLSHDGLPAHGTFDYYAAMAHRDHLFKARRLADGNSTSSSSPFLTFSGGNSTFRLSTLGLYVLFTIPISPFTLLHAYISYLSYVPTKMQFKTQTMCLFVKTVNCCSRLQVVNEAESVK